MIEIEGEAAGLGRQRHGAGAEVAAPGALHLAPIRDGVAHLSVTQLAMPLDGLEWARV